MCALDPRGQQNTAGEAGSLPRWPRAGDKRDPGSERFKGWGGFPGCRLKGCCRRGQARCLPREGPISICFWAHAWLAQGLTFTSETEW